MRSNADGKSDSIHPSVRSLVVKLNENTVLFDVDMEITADKENTREKKSCKLALAGNVLINYSAQGLYEKLLKPSIISKTKVRQIEQFSQLLWISQKSDRFVTSQSGHRSGIHTQDQCRQFVWFIINRWRNTAVSCALFAVVFCCKRNEIRKY